MKPQETIGIMKIAISEVEWNYPMDYAVAFETAIEALEKQEPKRTTYIHLNTRYTHWGRVRHDQFRCCNCGLTKEFVDGHASQYKFCPQCGLEIDWSDADAD